MFNLFKRKNSKKENTIYMPKNIDVPPVNKYQHLIDKFSDEKGKRKK